MSLPLRVERTEDLERYVTPVRQKLVRPQGIRLVPDAGSLDALDEFFAWSEPIRSVPARVGLITPQEFCNLEGLCEVGIRWFQQFFPAGYEGTWLQLAWEPVVPLGGRGWMAAHAPDIPPEERVCLAEASDNPPKWLYGLTVLAPTPVMGRTEQEFVADLAFTAQRRHEKAWEAGARQRPRPRKPLGRLGRLLRRFQCR